MRHFSFQVTALTVLALTVATNPLMAEDKAAATPPAPSEAASSLDPALQEQELLTSLKRERDATKAEGIAKDLIARWEDYGSATINALIKRGLTASNEKKHAAALDYFDQVITLEPQYAHAYYRRAYVNFAEGQTKKAIADLYKALELKPDHFGALFELARLLSFTGHDKPALAALERFLTIYPAFTEGRELYKTLDDKLAGTRT